MIFVGEGGLLQSTLLFTRQSNVPIDMVYSPTNELAGFCAKHQIPFQQVANINDEVESLARLVSDKIVFSINNGWLFRKPILSLPGFRFYNIHSGLIPKYRGKPEVCIIFALLNGEKEYGVSLHEIDENIDTGRCLAIKKFPLNAHTTFEDVMVQCLKSCEAIFNENLHHIIRGASFESPVLPEPTSKLYSYKDLVKLADHKTAPAYANATDFGLFEMWFSKAHTLISQL
ncbi:hypothetical protein E5K00_14430 [Hymenobacter aquaticus]|uniref:Formyl transferase N-terminal domain-containing protein n=1 Tax=Hymenobacter aquaticus TaxID=1867101 RepID=A0A4Z0PVZ2_9BACT|nr:formyltransferase family protein [Hymenobacter aquaticus]TGE21479.1 hypothetical protein E5K00_14430 [Hymenobacter aquaticus]